MGILSWEPQSYATAGVRVRQSILGRVSVRGNTGTPLKMENHLGLKSPWCYEMRARKTRKKIV